MMVLRKLVLKTLLLGRFLKLTVLLTLLTMLCVLGWTQRREDPTTHFASRFPKKSNVAVFQDTSGKNLNVFSWSEQTSDHQERGIWDGQSALCEPNGSAASDPEFSKHSQLIQNFLMHRHCTNFERIIEPHGKCSSSDVFLLIAIKTDARNLDRRDIIRNTWGMERQIKGFFVKRLFLLGVNPEPSEGSLLNSLLQKESLQHGDIIQWNFIDTFFNLTVKQVLFLDWLKTDCSNVKFIFNVDDDVYVNTENAMAFLLHRHQSQSAKQHLYAGMIIQNVGPIRLKSSKYYIPKQIQESDKYPPYAAGGGILMSYWTAMQIHYAVPLLPILPIDDVFLAQCLEKQGLKPEHHRGIHSAGLRAPRKHSSSFHPCYYREMLLIHRLRPYQNMIMWNAVHDPNLKCIDFV
uniref:Hexosyltransferase n=1 Tax=Eptatretus burgeri TaxID=7764 RepID=A0A8C4NLH0_EPTBU